MWAATWENRIFAYAKTKTQISFAVTAKLISAFVFATWIVQSLIFPNPKFQVSSYIQWLRSPVCVGPGRKPRRPVFSRRGSCRKWASSQENMSAGFKATLDIDQAVQPQKMPRGLKFWIRKLWEIILFRQWKTKTLIAHLICAFVFCINNQRTNGPVNAHLISGPWIPIWCSA